jgi:1-phosphofructokinase
MSTPSEPGAATATSAPSASSGPTGPTCAVIGPWLYLTVTVEREGDRDEVHLHPGGQGFWIARILATLGCRARLVAPVGGEGGAVLSALVPDWVVQLDAISMSGATPVQVHDRRTGERQEIVAARLIELDRHELDDLYAAGLASALASDAVVLTAAGVLPDDAYGRFTHDLAAADTLVCADMHGDALTAALDGGPLDLLKVSEDDLADDGWSMGDEAAAVRAAQELRSRGAATVVISRSSEPAIAALTERTVRVTAPALQEVDHRGAGDSMSGAMVAALAFGLDPIDALRFGAAAGAGNVARHGLGSGDPELVQHLSELVEVDDL